MAVLKPALEAWVYRHPRARCIFATGFARVCFARKLSGISASKSGTAVWVTEDARYRSDTRGRDRAASYEKVMRVWWRFTAIGVLAATMMLALGSNPGMAQSRAHVYLLRGLMNIFSLGMDTLAAELNKRGVYATVDNHADWQSLADQAAAKYKAGTEGPIILIGHSLGADAVMEMAEYLGNKGVPVALVVPFDGTTSFSASPNIARVLNLTQRDYAYMRRGPGFHGSLINVDVSSDPNIDHLTIDKSPRLHARVISEGLAVVGGHRTIEPGSASPT